MEEHITCVSLITRKKEKWYTIRIRTPNQSGDIETDKINPRSVSRYK